MAEGPPHPQIVAVKPARQKQKPHRSPDERDYTRADTARHTLAAADEPQQ